MAASPRLPTQLRELVRQRAAYLCEYCKTNERWQYVRFTIDHVMPLRAGGVDDFENLALACFHCNRRKSNRQTAVDPSTSEEVQLFNPRKDKWLDHFSWSSDGFENTGDNDGRSCDY